MKNTNSHWVYLAVVFILSFLWQLIIYFNGGIDSPLIPIMMLFPAIVAIAFRIINKEGFRNVGWGLRKWWYIFPSVMVPVLIILVIGWRAYVQEKLIRKYGLNGGLILLGVVWGYWHLPIGLMGWNFPEHPLLGALILTPLSTIFLGIFLGWLYLRSKSIWMPALAHAAVNLTATLLFSELIMQKDDFYLQLMFIASWGIVAGLCLLSLNRKKPLVGLP